MHIKTLGRNRNDVSKMMTNKVGVKGLLIFVRVQIMEEDYTPVYPQMHCRISKTVPRCQVLHDPSMKL